MKITALFLKFNNFCLSIMMLALLLSSCESDIRECYEVVDIRANNAFTQRIAIDSTFTLPDSTQIDSIFITQKDTLLPAARMVTLDEENQFAFYPFSATPNKLSIALNPASESLRYQLQFDTAVAFYDTLTFFYKPSLHFISNACGYTYYYAIDIVHFTNNALDSIAYPDKNVTNEAGKTNIQFYFFP